MTWEALTAAAASLTAGLVLVRVLLSMNRRLNEHAERLARVEGEQDRKD